MDRLYVLEDSVKSLFWKILNYCASGTTLGQRAQVSMLGRTSDAASNINLFPEAEKIPAIIFRAYILTEAQPRLIWRGN